MDLFMYYVDDICEQKIRNLNNQLQVYQYSVLTVGLTIAVITLAYLLHKIVGIFRGSLTTDKLPSLLQAIPKEQVAKADQKPKPKWNSKFGPESVYDLQSPPVTSNSAKSVNKQVYMPRWDIPKAVKDRAMFWKPDLKNRSCLGYESLLDLYANQTQSNVSNININQRLTRPNSRPFSGRPNPDIESIKFQRVRDFSRSDLGSSGYGNSAYSTARIFSNGSIQKTPLNFSQDYKSPNLIPDLDISRDIVAGADDSRGRKLFSRSAPTSQVNSSIDVNDYSGSDEQEFVLEDESDESEKGGYQSVGRSIKSKNDQSLLDRNETHISKKSKSEDNIALYSTNKAGPPDSMKQTLNLSQIGPTYLYVYMNMIYGNWNDFEERTLVIDPLKSRIQRKATMPELLQHLNIIKKNSISNFKKDSTLLKLESIRFSYMDIKLHETILNVIVENVMFLCKAIKNKKLSGAIKLEVYRLFFYSFGYESSVQLSFDFACRVINGMINSISFLNKSSIEYNDGMRCLHGILCCTNVEDFASDIFAKCFNGINNFESEKQDTTWEILKLVICEWMLDADSIDEIKHIYDTLKPKIGGLSSRYVEKDNEKYSEFLLIWNMIKEQSTDVEETNENQVLLNKVGEKKDIDSKGKRRLSRVKKQHQKEKLQDMSNIVD